MDKVHIDVTAYHEAAHAIVGLWHGWSIKEVMVSKVRPGNGLTKYYPRSRLGRISARPGNVKAAWLKILKNYKADICVSLAGPLAEAKLLHTPLRSLGARSDLEDANESFRRLKAIHERLSQYATLTEEVPDDLLQKLRRKTRSLVGRTGIWNLIDAVAIELVWCSSLSGNDTARIIQQVVNKHGQYGMYDMFC